MCNVDQSSASAPAEDGTAVQECDALEVECNLADRYRKLVTRTAGADVVVT